MMEAEVFSIAYGLLLLIFILHLINQRTSGVSDLWEYGTCNSRIARRHKIDDNVQFILWEAGKQGHTEDYWHNFDSSWWPQFKESK